MRTVVAMSRLPFQFRSAIVGAMLSVSTIGVQSVATGPAAADTRGPNAQDSWQAVAPALERMPIRDPVAPPSSDFTTYIEGELVRVSIPSNWRELPGANAVTFAPEGAYGNAGVKSVFTHGLGIGLARNDKRDLRETTDDFIDSYGLVNPDRPFRYSSVTIGDRPGLHTVLSSVSEATGTPERIEMYTTLLRDGTLLYLVAVVPRDCASDYAGTFRRIVGSIELMDGDRRARQ